jgi:hypothetical protein
LKELAIPRFLTSSWNHVSCFAAAPLLRGPLSASRLEKKGEASR